MERDIAKRVIIIGRFIFPAYRENNFEHRQKEDWVE
jgi:hypothetical protein